jgi:hypothetical protein
VTPDSTQAIFGHAANGEDVRGDLGHQGTHMDALGHFGFINHPGDAPTYFGGLTQSILDLDDRFDRDGGANAEAFFGSSGCLQRDLREFRRTIKSQR